MSRFCLLNPRWWRTIFSVANRNYQWFDVFLAATLRGEWRPFEQRLVEGLACLAEAESRRAWPEARRIDEAATAFRYERDLLTTEETVAWIERAGLTFDDWTDFLIRRLLRAEWSDRLDVFVNRGTASLAITDGAFATEGICSGAFDRWAMTLAGWAAVGATLPEINVSCQAFDRARSELIQGDSAWFHGLDAADLTRRVAHVAQLELTFDVNTQATMTPGALAAQLDRNRLDWMRVDLERLSFDAADAAREAACCVREDGLTLSDVAIESGESVRDTRELLERLEPQLRDAVLSARVDELVGPVSVGARYEVAWVVGKACADLADPLVRARAEEAVVEQLVSKAILSHIRWVERPRL